MKVFFDTNVYIAEALLGVVAESLLAATINARWRICISDCVLEEIERVMREQLDCTPRFAYLSRQRCLRRASHIADPDTRHQVPDDPADGPILRAAVTASADYLVTNDAHLLQLNPYEGIRIMSMTKYHDLLQDEGML